MKKIIMILFSCINIISAKAQIIDHVDATMLYVNSDVTVLEDAQLLLTLYNSPIRFTIQLKQQSFKSGRIPTLSQESHNVQKVKFTKLQWQQNTGDSTIGYTWEGGNGYTYLMYYTKGATAVLVTKNGIEVGIFTVAQNIGDRIERVMKFAVQKGAIEIVY